MSLDRRAFLGGASLAGGVALAGCLERLGFERESAWRNPPMVEDRPDAVYVPAATEEMGVYGTASDNEYAVTLSYTFPHRFWVVADTVQRVEVGTDDTHHLMVTVWDPETSTVLPVDMFLEIHAGGEVVTELAPWPMLSQRMGFHYGDNVVLSDEGSYTARLTVGPITTARRGAFTDRFDSSSTFDIEFEYSRSDILDLSFEEVDPDRQGGRGALPLMSHEHNGDEHNWDDHGDDHGDEHNGDGHDYGHNGDENGHDHGNGHNGHAHPPTSDGPPIDDMPASLIGTETTGDAAISTLVTDEERFVEPVRNDGAEAESNDAGNNGGNDEVENGDESIADEDDKTGADDTSPGSNGTYLIVCPRTPYNDVILPFTSIRATIERNGSTVFDDALDETLHDAFGHHYGSVVESFESGDEVTIYVESPPQVSRHDGYETAFFDFEPVTFTV